MRWPLPWSWPRVPHGGPVMAESLDSRPENNAWCVALDIPPQEGSPDMPFLFSCNLDIQRLDQASPDAMRDIPP